MSNNNRPLSPHLQVYKPQITSVLSILHRLTGVGLVFGMLMITWWLLAISLNEEAFNFFHKVAGSFIVKSGMFSLLWALCYHLLNGIRHLFWDTGMGINMKSVRLTGWLVVIGALVLSSGLWFWALTGV